ncbi:MAG: hypothetical protein GF330_11930 [Candidatus Eisenbacteria bacterium]|nr:hypothetical protein [Candidatus Eisenbacteria bacterium]
MRVLLVLLCATLLILTMPGASAQRMVGYSEETVAVPDPRSTCSVGEMNYHYDGSIENGYCWDSGGTGPPYYGAFAEAFNLGPGTINCAAFWLTQIGYVYGTPLDCYVWDGGISGEPAEVLCVVPGLTPTNIPYWPDCGRNDFQVGCDVAGEFTVGWWVDWPHYVCEWYTCVDQNGPGGHPWTCVLPGVGYPTGWQHPEVIWGGTASLAIGVLFLPADPAGVEELPADRPPAACVSWGEIRSLFGH